MKLPEDLSSLPYGELYELWKANLKLTKKIELPDDPIPRCGYYFLSTSWVYNLFGCADPFLHCCLAHDLEFELKRKPRRQVDKEFLECCLARAGDSSTLKARAYLYYGIVRSFGYFVW